MARKPNYKFERHERDRAKAAKKAAKAEEKRAKAAEEAGEDDAERIGPLNGGLPPESD